MPQNVKPLAAFLLLLLISLVAAAETRLVSDTAKAVRFVGPGQANTTHDGGLRWAVGVKSWQALRANRSHPELADGFGWTYNHAPMLAYWRNRF